MDAELIYKAQAIHKQVEELETHAGLIDHELVDLKRFKNDLDTIEKNPSKQVLSSLGKGVFIKTDIIEKELFVEVGAGYIVKKNSAETRAVIDEQIKKISEARLHNLSKLELYQQALQQLIQNIQLQQTEQKKNE